MGAALKLIDETASGHVIGELTLQLVSDRLTVRELIDARVRQEVTTFNAQAQKDFFRGLVQPTDAERYLNGYKLRRRKTVDADAQIERALAAFQANGFLLLVDDKQLESLDDELLVTPETHVAFVKLVPLVGG